MTKRARVSPEAAASLSWHGGEAPQSAARRWGDAIVSTRPVYLGCVGGEAAMGGKRPSCRIMSMSSRLA